MAEHCSLSRPTGKAAATQRVEAVPRHALSERRPVQAMRNHAAQLNARPANRTGIPDRLKTGIEALSGIALDDVTVHRNSSRPAQLQALAFAQGTDIHLGPGQERHLPHEAWHVVQQKQGRVQPTMRSRGAAINNDIGLEREADRMGARATAHAEPTPVHTPETATHTAAAVAQCVGHVRFANLHPDYQEKGDAIIDGLRNTPSIATYLGTRDVLITLEFEAQLASIRVVGDQVQIKLSPWFFEQQSRGRILGMLAHEFGVHPLARAAMTPLEITDEDNAVTANTSYPTGVPGHDIRAGEAGQRDHVFAAVASEPRFVHYRQTVFGMARAMHAASQGAMAHGVTPAHVTDLIMTYLSDLAMILATNDHRWKVAFNAGLTAQIFNLERLRWINSLNANDPVEAALINLTPAQKTGGDVVGEVTAMMGSFALGPARNSKSDANYEHDNLMGGQLAPVTRIQADVIADHALALIGPELDLFAAIENAGGLSGVQATVATRLGTLAKPSRQQIRIRDKLGAASTLYNPLSWDALNLIGWALNRTIRVLQPDGKMIQADYGTAARISIAWVKEPDPHYRVLM